MRAIDICHLQTLCIGMYVDKGLDSCVDIHADMYAINKLDCSNVLSKTWCKHMHGDVWMCMRYDVRGCGYRLTVTNTDGHLKAHLDG